MFPAVGEAAAVAVWKNVLPPSQTKFCVWTLK